jgi:hypothetical protein
MGGFEKIQFVLVEHHPLGQTLKHQILRSITLTDATSRLDVLRHNNDTLGVTSAQVGAFEQPNSIGFRRLLGGSGVSLTKDVSACLRNRKILIECNRMSLIVC